MKSRCRRYIVSLGVLVAFFGLVDFVAGQLAPQFPDVTEMSQYIDAAQRAYYTQHQRYAQVFTIRQRTHAQAGPSSAQEVERMLSGGFQVLADVSPLPTPQVQQMTTFTSPLCPADQGGCPVAMPVPVDVTARVDVYAGPRGAGYEIVYEYTAPNGDLWRRVDAHGPEPWRSRDWFKVSQFFSPLSPLR